MVKLLPACFAFLVAVVSWADTKKPSQPGPYFLIGTVIRSEPEVSIATIAKARPDSRENYFVKSKIDPRATVVKIEREKVTLRVDPGGQELVLRTPPYDPSKTLKGSVTKSIKPGKEAEYHIPRSTIDKTLDDLPQILMKAGTEPVKDKDGRITGYKLTFIEPKSIFETLGLSVGDEVQEVNGRKIDSVLAAMELLQQLRDSSLVKVKIKRGNSEFTPTYLVY